MLFELRWQESCRQQEIEPFTKQTRIVAVLDRANVDMDQIIPSQFLKRIEKTGYGGHPGKSEVEGGSS